jgi:Beta protein
MRKYTLFPSKSPIYTKQVTLPLDLLWIAAGDRMAGGEHPLTYIFRTARESGLQPIPVTGLVRDEDYQSACREAIQEDGRGACVRLQREDFEDIDSLTAQVNALLDTLGASPGECDLLLDLRAVGVNEGSALLATVPVLVRSIPQLQAWRSFVLAATAFPEDLIGLPPSSISFITRLEWIAWRTLIGRSRVPRLPAFGDYVIANPQLSEVDPRIMRPSASIRYTTDDAWLIMKGRNLRDYGYAEFYDVCRELVGRPEYSGPGFSWGDRYIDECANQRVGTGNLTTWRKVGTSHHLAVVTRQIASLV